MDPIVGVLIGLAAGGVIGYLWARGGAATAAERARAAEDERARLETQLSAERTARTAAESDREAARARADESEKRVQERDQFIKGFVETSRGDQQNAYAKLSQAALEATTKQFLELANQTLQATARGAAGDLEVRKKEIEGLLAPMRDELGKLASAANAMEQKRSEAYGTIQQLVSSLSGQAQRLEKQTLDLTSALRGSSQARGRWGEAQFRRIVELAGMLEHCDFDEQKEASDGSRPDAIVHLPGERTIAIDAKAPLSAYFEAVELAEPAARAEALARHAAAVRGHVKALSQRNYPEQLENSVDFVVMFLPGDSLLAAAFEGIPMCGKRRRGRGFSSRRRSRSSRCCAPARSIGNKTPSPRMPSKSRGPRASSTIASPPSASTSMAWARGLPRRPTRTAAPWDRSTRGSSPRGRASKSSAPRRIPRKQSRS